MTGFACAVIHASYSAAFDLTGQNVVMMQTRTEVEALLGPLTAKDSMASRSVDHETVTTKQGDVADEVHEWPNATQGERFRRLAVLLRRDEVLEVRWGFSLADFLPKQPWYKRLFS